MPCNRSKSTHFGPREFPSLPVDPKQLTHEGFVPREGAKPFSTATTFDRPVTSTPLFGTRAYGAQSSRASSERADGLVVGGCLTDIGDNGRHIVVRRQVTQGHDPDEVLVVHHWQASDVVLTHQRQGLVNGFFR